VPLNRFHLVFLSLFAIIGLLSFVNGEKPSSTRAHGAIADLPFAYNDLFTGSGQCLECHGHDAEGIASVTLEGQDVNVMDAWRSTMMANSARDPFWQAKVSHEVTVNPGLSQEIEDKCTTCHAPLGHFNAHYIGEQYYSMSAMFDDSLAMDGVSCLACHQQTSESFGQQFSGGLTFDTARVAYGQYESPLASPMIQFAEYEPKQGLHIEDAALCGGCHTLITGTVDLEGMPTGDEFVEQATYHEWLNSTFSGDEGGATCQQCHMPSLGPEEIHLIAGFETPARTPFYLHEFAGANTLMLKLIKENASELGVPATDDQFDATIAATNNLLQSQSLDLSMEFIDRTFDNVVLELRLENLAGHKFPSGYPSRRLVVEFVVDDEDGQTIFQSGVYENDFSLANEDVPFEPHHEVISSPTQVQIYELVMGDIEGNFTTVLDRAFEPLKDNRLVPKGFTTTHFAYDTTLMAGAVLLDADFNKEFGTEGSGTDHITFEVPLDGYDGPLHIEARVHYQSLPPRWMEEIFTVDTEPINSFQAMFDAADQSPVLIDEVMMDLNDYVGIQGSEQRPFALYPTIGRGDVVFTAPQRGQMRVFGLQGVLVATYEFKGGRNFMQLNLAAGQYIVLRDFGDSTVVDRITITSN
jgi:hypothetical protein